MPRTAAAVQPPALGFSELRLSVDVRAGIVHLAGTLDRFSAHHLSDAVSALRSGPSPIWTLDLSGVTFCDVEGLRVVHRARVLAGDRGRVLHVRGASRALTDLLDLLDAVVRADLTTVRVRVAAEG